MPNVLLIEGCNFVDYPVGGQLSFAKQMMKAFGNRLALVGWSTNSTPVGRWVRRSFGGVEYDFFAMGRVAPRNSTPIIPPRLLEYMQLRKHKKTILSLGVKHAFVQAPEALCAIEKWGLSSICCYSAGLTNPLTMPRYRWGKLLARPFMRWWVSALAKCDVTLAAASQTEIDIFIVNSGRKLAKGKIISLPTRVDTSLFRPMDKTLIRQELGIARDDTVIANCGRINVVKGWELLVESCRVLLRRDCKVRLVFIGDGDDRQKLDKYVCKCGLSARVTVTGYLSAEEVAKYLNAADVIAVASFHEGWSVSMLEALACGKAIVSTDVSGARDMIVDGANGFIVATRDPESFADAITRAVALDNVHRVSLAMAEKYTLKNLGRELGRLWEPLS